MSTVKLERPKVGLAMMERRVNEPHSTDIQYMVTIDDDEYTTFSDEKDALRCAKYAFKRKPSLLHGVYSTDMLDPCDGYTLEWSGVDEFLRPCTDAIDATRSMGFKGLSFWLRENRSRFTLHRAASDYHPLVCNNGSKSRVTWFHGLPLELTFKDKTYEAEMVIRFTEEVMA